MLQSSVIKNSKPCTEVGSVTEENLFLPASHRLTQFTSLSTFFLFLTKKGSLFKWMFKQVWTVRYSEVKWYSSVVSDSLGLHGPIQSMEFSRPEYWSELAFPFSSRSSQPRDCLLHCRQILYQLSHKGSPVWQALAGHKRRIPLAVVLPRPARLKEHNRPSQPEMYKY